MKYLFHILFPLLTPKVIVYCFALPINLDKFTITLRIRTNCKDLMIILTIITKT